MDEQNNNKNLKIKFQKNFSIRLPKEAQDSIEKIANKKHYKKATLCRQYIIEGIIRDEYLLY